MSRCAAAALLALALAGVGCASDTRTYYWANYQWSAYSGNQIHRGGPQSEKFEATLARIIQGSDEAGRKIAPGVLAEYGYLHYRRGEMDSAIRYFEREAREWPESAKLMGWMIEQAQRGPGS